MKTFMIDLFDDRYAALAEVVAAAATVTIVLAGIRGERSFQYGVFDHTKPPQFDGFKDPIMAMRWLSDLKGFFFTCSSLDDKRSSAP